ncbi:MAG: SDR family NAD(P)-dependent oxidoreductase [Pseudomonadota bacterium]
MAVDGKTVIITGASRGIGEAAAEVFAEAGANVGLLARNSGAISEIADRIGSKAMAVACDVSDFTSMESAISSIEKHFGPTEVLINNAGAIEPVSHLATAEPDAWSHVIDINLKGVFYGMRAVMPGMMARGSGTILTVSSGAAHGPVEAWSHYCSSKAGAAMLTRCADKEAGEAGLRVMGLSPGTVATQMQKEIKASGINPVSQLDWTAHIPADWPAKALLWMCDREADEFVGQEISLRDEGIRRRIGLIS